MPIIQDPRMNPFVEHRYGIIKMEDGRFVAYDKRGKSNDQDTRYLPWGWNIDVSDTETTDDPVTHYNDEPIKELATKYNLHRPQGPVVRRVQQFICTDPDAIFRGVQNGVGLPRKPQEPPSISDDEVPNV